MRTPVFTGSCPALVTPFDQNGAINYDAFGKPHYNEKLIGTDTVSSVIFRIGYKGYYYVSDSGLYFTGKGYYNPETGRYLVPQSVDNLGFETDRLNLFAYCHNRPLNVSEVKIPYANNTALANSADLDISQALLIGAGAIGDVLDIAGTALDFVRILKNTKVFGTFNKILTRISTGLELLRNITTDFDIWNVLYIVGAIVVPQITSQLGLAIGTLIGGLPGAIFGTIFSILLATLFEDLFKQIFGI